jgi:hypothetical protein
MMSSLFGQVWEEGAEEICGNVVEFPEHFE